MKAENLGASDVGPVAPIGIAGGANQTFVHLREKTSPEPVVALLVLRVDCLVSNVEGSRTLS